MPLTEITKQQQSYYSLDTVYWQSNQVHLGYNNLTNVSFDQFSNAVMFISLSHNSIEIVCQKELTTLMSLDLSWNKLRIISKECFAGLSGLKRLLLDHNHLTEISANVFPILSSLRHLNLAHNSITTISFARIQLDELNLSHNKLTHFSTHPNMSIHLLDLSHNQLTHIKEGDFRGNQSTHVVLSNNKISAVDSKAFQYPGMWTEIKLNLSHNRLTSFSKDSIIGRVEWLDLSNNNIREVSCSLFSRAFTDRLYLHDNNIAYLDRCAASMLGKFSF